MDYNLTSALICFDLLGMAVNVEVWTALQISTAFYLNFSVGLKLIE